MRGRITGQEKVALLSGANGAPNVTKAKGRRGFSLLETTIAMALIAIVFAMAITTVQAASTTHRRSQNRRFFVTEISNYLECYRMDGGSGFKGNVQTYLGVDLGVDSAEYWIYYDANYRIVTTEESSAFLVIIEIGSTTEPEHVDATSSFFAKAEDASGKEIYSSGYFVSRHDLPGGGA